MAAESMVQSDSGQSTNENRPSFAELGLSEPLLRHPEIRLDLDYAEDFELVQAIYQRLYQPGQVPDLRRILRLLLEEEPALAQLNRAAHEKWLSYRAVELLPLALRGDSE